MKHQTTLKWLVPVGIGILVLAGLVWVVGSVWAQQPDPPPETRGEHVLLPLGAQISDNISYQGRLLDSSGSPLNGTYEIAFRLYDAASGGLLKDTDTHNVEVVNGFFNTELNFDPTLFDGQAYWIEMQITGDPDPLDPRVKILPVPYALSLVPGARVDSAATGTDWGDAVFNVWNGDTSAGRTAIHGVSGSTVSGYPSQEVGVLGEAADGYGVAGLSDTSTGVYGSTGTDVGVWGAAATGSAVYGSSSSGYGVYGYSMNNYAVYGYDGGTTQARGYGGYFTSTNGVGVFGYSGAASHYANMYAPGVYGRSANGTGVYGLSDGTAWPAAGVRGESTSGPGVSGSSTDDYGIRGYSANDYAGYFYSGNYRGLYATSPSGWYAGYFVNRGGSTQPGLYVDGDFVASGSKTGYVVDIALNEGPEPLETGDVVVVTGFSEPIAGEIPVIAVRKATKAASTGVVGVVDQPFTVQTSPDDEGRSMPKPVGGAARIASGTAISRGEYLSVVTLGSFKAIKVDASYGAIQPGDLLVSSPTPGYAMRVEDPRVGTVIGKALGASGEGTGVIPVLVTLH